LVRSSRKSSKAFAITRGVEDWIFPISLLACIIFLIRFRGSLVVVVDEEWGSKEGIGGGRGFCMFINNNNNIITIYNKCQRKLKMQ